MRTYLFILLCSGLLLINNPLFTQSPGYVNQDDTISVLTFNIFHGETRYNPNPGYKSNLEIVAGIINDLNPDLVALQEVDRITGRSKGLDLIVELARLTGMTPLFGKTIDFDGGEYGLGILSRYSFLSTGVRPLFSPPNSEPRIALESLIVLETGDTIRFICTHLDHSRDSLIRKKQASDINNFFARDKLPTILAGDLNALPQSEAIAILKNRWTDTWQGEARASYITPNPARRIDYIMYRPSDFWEVLDSRVIDGKKASDHNPVLSVFRLKNNN